MKKTSLLFLLLVLFAISSSKAQTTVSDADGNQYNIITIGTQKWTKENLKTTKYSDGSNIDSVSSNTAWSNLTTGAFCHYPTYGAVYGNLYNFYAVANPKNICPSGWHVATYDEWNDLVTYLGGQSVAGSKLKEIGTAHWGTPNTDATNESGFTAFGGGYRKFDGVFYNILDDGYFWHGTETGTDYAWYSVMDPSSGYLNITDNDKKDGMSVRCIKNSSTGVEESNIQLYNIFPNLTSGKFQLEVIGLDFGKNSALEIYNMQGEKIYQSVIKNSNIEIDLSNKTKGIYFVKIYDEQTIITKKIVVN